MLDKNVKVPLPEHGIAYKKMGDKTYVYYATAVYRNAKGQPTCDRSSIGRLDEETGMLIPNRNYYEIYLKQPQPPTGAIFHYGVYHVFSSIVKEFGISSLLKKYFPGKEDEILTAAQYMLSEGNVMAYIEDYTEDHETFSHGIVSDKRISELFSSLREEDILLFLREWMGKRKKGEYIAYDVTSVSTYSGGISEAEWGYNRDKEKLPQINLGGVFRGRERTAAVLPDVFRQHFGQGPSEIHGRGQRPDGREEAALCDGPWVLLEGKSHLADGEGIPLRHRSAGESELCEGHDPETSGRDREPLRMPPREGASLRKSI